jgi:hypothetical protein
MNQILPQHLTAETFIQTPIGKLKFYSIVSDGSVEKINISQCDVSQSLPEGMRVPTTIAVLLQFSVMEPIKEFSFCCAWENLKIPGYGCHGEALEAYEWEDENYIVIVGTEDPDYLNHRIPSVPAEPSDVIDYPITMEENEIRIHLRELAAEKCYSLHYAVTWNKLPQPKGYCLTSNVDLPHELVRKSLINN